MNQVNLLGFFTHLADDCELYDLLGQIGLDRVLEVGRCGDPGGILELGASNLT